MPEKFKWLPEYSVGNPKMDAQHQKLLAVCVDIAELTKQHGSEFTDNFHLALNELTNYAGQHLADEEKLLQDTFYPDFSEHKREHEEYFTTLSEILFNAVNGAFDAEKLNAFAGEWWVNHILNSDMKYKQYFSQN